MTSEPERPAKRSGGSYFAVCSWTMERVIETLGFHAALVYLVLARGSGQDHVTTAWGVHAVEQREILGRVNAQKALAQLQQENFVSARGKGNRRKLCARKQVDVDAKGRPILAPRIWLPNCLVDGIEGRTAPLTLLRQAGSLDALVLLLGIYRHCRMPEGLGVPVHLIRKENQLRRFGERDKFAILGVCKGRLHVSESFAVDLGLSIQNIVEAYGLLAKLQLVVDVPYIFTGNPGEEEPLFPADDEGEGAEREFGREMTDAAKRMLVRPYRGAGKRGDVKEGFYCFVAIPQHAENPRRYSIIRPRYQADTEMNRQMLKELERWRGRAVEWKVL